MWEKYRSYGLLGIIVALVAVIVFLVRRIDRVVEKYEVKDYATYLESVTSNKILIKYNEDTYRLVLSKPIDFIEGKKVSISIKYSETSSGNVYSTITQLGDFKVSSCTKVVN